MMRKFSFSIRETFGSGKSDRKGSRDGPYCSDDYSPPPSPHPGRRDPLPARIEIDLRLACAGIVNDTIPSDAYAENPYEELGRPQKDYTAWRSHSETGRQWLTSGSKNARNFSNSAANNDFPEFPIPKGPLDRSKYAYKPDTALKDLFAERDQSQFISRAEQNRRRAESTTVLDKEATPRAQTGRQASKSFSVASNLPLDQLPVRPKQVRYGLSQGMDCSSYQADLSECNLSDAGATTSASLAAKRAKHASYHAPARVDPEIYTSKEKDLERKRRSWYRPFGTVVGETHTVGQREGRTRSRAESISKSTQEHNTSDLDGRIHSRDPLTRSSDSRRSSASSGVIPGGGSVFSWKNFRQSWNSWRDSSDFEQEFSEKRLSNRRSGASIRKRNTLIVNRDLAALPSIDQWQGEDTSAAAHIPEQNAATTSSDQPRHIVDMWEKSSANTKDVVEKKTAVDVKKQYRKTMVSLVPPETVKSPAVAKTVEYRKSCSDFSNFSNPKLSHADDPILPHVLASMSQPRMSFHIKRKPVPTLRSTPTDSLMDGQGVTISPPQEIKTAEVIGIAKSTPEVITDAVPTKMVAIPAKAAFSVSAKVVSIPAKTVPISAKVVSVPAKSGETKASISPTSTIDQKSKRTSAQYSWLPVEQDYTPTSRSASVSAKRKSGSYSWLPAESAPPPASDKRVSMVRRRSSNQSIREEDSDITPPSDRRPSVALRRRSSNQSMIQENTDTAAQAETRTGSITAKRISDVYAFVISEIAQATTIQIQRPTRINVVAPINVASAVPKRIMEKLHDPITGETEFISRDPSVSSESSTEFFNSLKAPQFQYADDISHLGSPLHEPEKVGSKKFRWKLGKKKSTTWMDEMEKLGIKAGILLQDQLDSAPIVRY